MAVGGLFLVAISSRGVVADPVAPPNPHASLSAAQRQAENAYWANELGRQFGVPQGSYERALAQTSLERAHALAISPAASWSYIGPQPMLGNYPNFGGVFTGPALTTSEGRVAAVAADPNHQGLIYVGAAGGGVWRSTDGGATFVSVFDSEPSQAIGAIAVDKNSNVYVGTGEAALSSDAYYGRGLFISTDGGDTWAMLGPSGQFALSSIGRIAVDTNTPPDIFVAAATGKSASRNNATMSESDPQNNGLWRSSDGGSTWTQVGNTTLQSGLATFNNCAVDAAKTEPCAATDVVVDANNPARVFAAILGVNVFGSTDGGNTWAEANFPGIQMGTTGQTYRQSLAVTSSGPGGAATVYSAVGGTASGDSYYLGFFRSTDSGGTWAAGTIPSVVLGTGQNTTTLDGDGNGQGAYANAWYDQTIAVVPAHPTTVYFGGTGPYISTDGAASWQFIGGSISNTNEQETHADQHASAIDPFDSNKLYIGNDGGFYVYDLKGGSWSNYFGNTQNQTISAGQIQGVGPHPTDNNTVLFGFQDNGTGRYAGQTGWQIVETGDAGAALFDQVDPKYAYHTFASTNCGTALSFQCPAPARSTDGGYTWNDNLPYDSLYNVIGNDQFGFYPPVASDPNTAHRVFIGGHMIYVSTDGMGTWSVQSGDLTNGCGLGNTGCTLQDIEFVPATTMAWALSITSRSKGFQLSNTSAANVNSGGSWTNVTANLGFDTSKTQATGIAVDPLPGHSNIAYLSISGFSAQTGIGHIYMTPDFGQTWSRNDGNGGSSALPDVPTLRILVDKNDTTGSTLLAGTDIGVFRSTDAGQTWVPFNNGVIPAVPIFDLEQNQNGVIFAGSHGRGAFRLNPAPAPTATASPTPVPSPTPTSAPTATVTVAPSATISPSPTPGAVATSVPASVSGAPGATVAAGTMTLNNTTASAESVGSVTISVSHPALFSSMTLSGGGQSVTVTQLSTTTVFVFSAPLPIAPGGALSFSLSATLSASAMLDNRAFALADVQPTGSGQSTGGPSSLFGALMLVGLLLAPIRDWSRRRLALVAAALLLLAVGAAGCGGSTSSSQPPAIASSQSVTAVSISNGSKPVSVGGLPASLGTVSVS